MSSIVNREMRYINHLVYQAMNQTKMIKNIYKVTSKIDCRIRILNKSIINILRTTYEAPPEFTHYE